MTPTEIVIDNVVLAVENLIRACTGREPGDQAARQEYARQELRIALAVLVETARREPAA